MSNQDNIAIEVKNVSKNFVLPHERVSSVKGVFTNLFKSSGRRFENQHALRDVSFNIKKGEFYGIVGRNGSGKSTMLKILAGIYQPTSGHVKTHGKLVPFIELGVGFNPELTGRENVFLNGAMLGFSQKEIDVMYKDIVRFAELERFMDQKLKNYSSGMQVRLAFSMAVRADADILLVDEVLAVGDADFQRKCFDYFRLLKKRKKTVVFVSHDMSAVREFCDKALLIDHSEVIAEGSADVIAQKYTQLFIDENSQEDEEENQVVEATVRPDGLARWGEGQVKIIGAQLSHKVLKDADEAFQLTITMEAVRSYTGLAVGFGVKDATGEPLFGTNSRIKHRRLPDLNPGETCKITWTCPNILADGKHTVDIALHDNEGIVVYDWWDDAISFTVKRSEKTAYKITPDVDLTIEKL